MIFEQKSFAIKMLTKLIRISRKKSPSIIYERSQNHCDLLNFLSSGVIIDDGQNAHTTFSR